MMRQARALADHSPRTDPLHDRFQLAVRYMEGAFLVLSPFLLLPAQ